MRRPATSTAQRQYAREQRALLTLRRAAVRFTDSIDAQDGESAPRLADLEASGMKYTATLTKSARRKLGRTP